MHAARRNRGGSDAVNLMTTFATNGSPAGFKDPARPIPKHQIPRSENRLTRRIAVYMAAFALTAMPITKAAENVFKETGGVVVIEAEHFTARTANTDGAKYTVIPDEQQLGQPGGTPAYINARGSYIVPLPDAVGGGVNHNGTTDALTTPPFVDYKVQISTPGDYRLWLRWGGYDGSSDSMYGQILELVDTNAQTGWYRYSRSIGANFASADWHGIGGLNKNNGGPDADDVPTVFTIPAAGTYTIRLTQREDGSGTDALILQLNSLPDPPAAPAPGPAESDLVSGFVLGTPADVTALPPNTATFTANAKTGPGATVTYQWQSKAPTAGSFTDISGATSASYTTGPTSQAMSGTQYRVVATSGGVTLTSGAATLITDATPPSLVHAFSGPANTQVTVQFSEPLNPQTATNFANYTFTGGLTVSAAKLSTDGKTVSLKTSAQTANTSYTVTVNGIKDPPGNILNGATATFKGPVQLDGQLLVRKYEGITGVAVNDLLNSPKYPDQPTSVTYWTAFGGSDIFATTGDNLGDNYGLEITGFIVPTTTANYEFYIASDDASSLWLSTDETAANASLIAQQPGCCNTFTHAPGGLSSNPIPLEAGKKYYVRAYLKEGGGGDFLSVAWKNSVDDGDITVAPDGNLTGIPAANLATGYDPTGGVSISTQPQNLTVKANAPFTFTVGYSAYSPVFGTQANVQWQEAAAGSSTFTDIPGATGVNFGGTFANPANSGKQYRAVVTAGDATVTSAPATLTVSGSVPLITLAKTIEQRYWTGINVNNIATLVSDPRYPNNPSSVTFEPLFEYGPNGSNESGSNYGNRLSGWLNPPEDGDYVFFTCSDDPSELYLSTDQDPAHKKLIAKELVWSNARQWTSSGGSSDLASKRSDQFPGTEWPTKDTVNGGAKITLQKGQHYYIEVLHTEGGGGDNVGVAWKKPSDAADPVDGDPPISADNVDQLYAVTGTVNFTTQPANTSAAANTSASFTAAATASDGSALSYVWQTAPAGSTDFVAVGTGTNYTTPLLTAADNNRQYRVLAFSPTGAGLSSVATLTVSADTVPPTVTYFTANRTSALIVFSEPIDATTGGALTSYSISGGSITGATVGSTAAGFGTVTLDLSGLTDLQNYTITIKNVKDSVGNTIVQTTKSFTAYDIYADFDGPVPPPKSTLTGTASIKANGSFDGSGLLELTPAAGSSQGSIGIDDMLAGLTPDSATNVTAQFKLFIGNGSGNPADGVSFNVESDIDPTTVNTGEEGTGGGLTIALDTYDNGGGEAPAIDVKWQGAVVATTIVPKATLVNNQWVDVFIQMTGDPNAGVGHVTVVHNNIKYYDNLEIAGWAPIDTPKVAIGGRTGGEFERAALDNLIVTYNADVQPPKPPTISITAPANGATLTAGSPATITVNVAADAGVNKVEFFANGQSLGSSTTAPYSLTIPQVAAGFFTVTATVTDKNGVAVTSAPINVVVRPPASANAPKVLFAHSSGGPNASDSAMMNHLFSLGYDVYPIAANTSGTADTSDKKLIVVSSSVSSGEIADNFRTTPVPVFNWENALQDNFQFVPDSDHGTVAGRTDLIIDDPNSPLAAGLSGTVTVTTSAQDQSWALSTSLPAGALKVASTTEGLNHQAIYAFDKGATLLDGTQAAARRAHVFMTDNSFANLTANGLKLVDAAVAWLTAGGTQQPKLTPALSGNNITITWTNGGTLEWTSAITPGGTWTSTGDSDGSYTEAINTAQNKFFRVKQ